MESIQPQSPPAPRKRWSGVFLLVATCLAYVPAVSCGFIWDDDDYVIKNQTLRDLPGLKAIWLDLSATPQYYPLVHTSFWCEYQCWGLNASGYHVTNIVIHGINAILLSQHLLSVRIGQTICSVF